MDARLVAWARAVKSRHRHARRPCPVLWLFTDERRLPDPRPSVARLPPGLAGVVLRHDGDPHRAVLGRDLARICRARRLALVVAGDVRLAAALGAGVHLRGGRWPGHARIRRGWLTSSAHARAELRRAYRAGADLVFLSPAFPTRSHPDAPGLGPARWSRLAHRANVSVAALGGTTHLTVRRLPRRLCRAVGAIDALA
jgi:thiamine-phosphate pyrophosphorylase